jgi:phospholipid-binding lipoprotein MlaA
MMTTSRTVSHLYALVLVGCAALAGCSTAPVQKGEIIEPIFPADRILQEGVVYEGQAIISDPWEGFNRSIYRFNYHFDRYVFLPGVRAYQAITPDIVETGIHNFFRNWQDVTTLINSILQLNVEKTMNTLTRLTLNSTVGLLGFIEIADDVPRSDEDFGQTLGYWGVGPGPYLVLPIVGPSSLRDGAGYGVDYLARSEIWDQLTDFETWQDWTINILWSLDIRAHTAFRYYETGSPFEYELVRMLWTTKRQLDVER